MATETRVVEVPVEVYPDLPPELIEPLMYPAPLPEDFTTGDLVDRVIELYDLLDRANVDRATLRSITERNPTR